MSPAVKLLNGLSHELAHITTSYSNRVSNYLQGETSIWTVNLRFVCLNKGHFYQPTMVGYMVIKCLSKFFYQTSVPKRIASPEHTDFLPDASISIRVGQMTGPARISLWVSGTRFPLLWMRLFLHRWRVGAWAIMEQGEPSSAAHQNAVRTGTGLVEWWPLAHAHAQARACPILSRCAIEQCGSYQRTLIITGVSRTKGNEVLVVMDCSDVMKW